MAEVGPTNVSPLGSLVVVVLFVIVSVTSTHVLSKGVHAQTPLATVRAVQRVLVAVHCQLVLPSVTGQCEPHSALRAGVGLLTRVGQQVVGEVTPLRELFSTLGAHVVLSASAFGRVLPPPVTRHVRRSGKALAAAWALVRLLPRVDQEVPVKIPALGEAPVTDVAHERPLARVDSLVLRHIATVIVRVRAVGALVLPLTPLRVLALPVVVQ